MHLLYIDDAGDDGRSPASSSHFILGGLAIQDWNWRTFDTTIEAIAQQHLGANARNIELHGSDILSGRNFFRSMQPADRDALFRAVLTEIGRKEAQLSLFMVVIHKDSVPVTRNIRVLATLQLCQRFNSHLTRNGAYGRRSNERGMLICDDHAVRGQIQSLMAVIHSAGLPGQFKDNLVETAFFVDSSRSRVLQAADIACHAALRFVRDLDADYFPLVERKIDRDVEKRRLIKGKPQMIHYGFRYIANDPSDGLSGPLPFRYLAPVARTQMPAGCFLKYAQLETELQQHGL